MYIPPGMEGDTRKMKLTIPMDESEEGPVKCIDIEIPVDRPLEDIGRRVAMFGRMESYSTWIAIGAGFAGLLAGILIGRATKR